MKLLKFAFCIVASLVVCCNANAVSDNLQTFPEGGSISGGGIWLERCYSSSGNTGSVECDGDAIPVANCNGEEEDICFYNSVNANGVNGKTSKVYMQSCESNCADGYSLMSTPVSMQFWDCVFWVNLCTCDATACAKRATCTEITGGKKCEKYGCVDGVCKATGEETITCNAGYYLDLNSNSCKECPGTNATSAKGTTSIKGCFIPKGTEVKVDDGTVRLLKNVYHN